VPPELNTSEQLSSLFDSLNDPRLPLEQLLSVLDEHQGVIFLADPADVARYLDEAQGTLTPQGESTGRLADAQPPRPLTVAAADGTVSVCVFTHVEFARRYATSHGLIATDDVLPYSRQPWSTGLRALLRNDVPSIVIDPGLSHERTVDRPSLVRLAAALDRPRLAALPALFAVVRERSIYVERLPSGERCVFAYDDEQLATGARENIASRQLPMGVEPRATERLLSAMVEAGIGRLVVNQGWPDRREYDSRDLALMKSLSARAVASQFPSSADGIEASATATPSGMPADRTTSAQEPSALQARARSRAADVPLAPPQDNDAAARAFFKAWQKKATAGTGEVWQFLEAMVYEATFYVPRSPEPLHGLAWPQVSHAMRQPENTESTIVHLFSSEAAARRALADRPEAMQRIVRLSGLEAFRWVFAHPADITDVAIDYGDADGWLSFPAFWLRDALFPMSHDLGDLSRVPRVALSRVGQLPGARGLKPEVVRALSQGWRALLGVRPLADGSTCLVGNGDRFHIPVFTDSDMFFAFQASRPDDRLVPEAAGNEPSFSRWLETDGASGVVINPGSPAPILLDPLALLVLDVQCRENRHATVQDAVEAVKGLEARGVSRESVAAIIAGLPSFWLALGAQPGGGTFMVHAPNDPDTGVLFSTGERLQQYLEANRDMVEQALGGTTEQLRTLCQLSRWPASPVGLLAEAFSAVSIDPRPDGSGGLRLDRQTLGLVLAHLDDFLCPRVPEFVVEG